MIREATIVRTPHATRPLHVQAFGIASTAAVATGSATENGSAGGGWYTFRATQDCHIEWGISTVGAAAAATSMFYPAGEWSIWLSAKEDTHLRVIRATADGSLYWHKSES